MMIQAGARSGAALGQVGMLLRVLVRMVLLQARDAVGGRDVV